MRKRISNTFLFIKQVFTEFFNDDIFKYSASLAYYTVFALAPMLIVIFSISGVLLGKEAMQGEVYAQISGMVGAEAAIQVQDTIKNSAIKGNNFFASTVSIIILFVAATGVFGEIQDSLNKIWGLKATPKHGWMKLLINRVLSFSLIVSLGFIMMVSLLLNALVASLSKYLGQFTSDFSVILVKILDYTLAFAVTTFIYALIFKVLPDAKIKWRDVIVGAIFTAVFFTLGKLGIGYYLGKSNLSSVYGAAGSIIIIMLWVYYSSIILYLGAEFTKVYAKLYGGKIFPNEYATWIKTEEVEVSNPALKQKVLD
ncbi:MAG: YihY/virulence factor BrkB family protein [Chitinophagaceae bacterium]